MDSLSAKPLFPLPEGGGDKKLPQQGGRATKFSYSGRAIPTYR